MTRRVSWCRMTRDLESLVLLCLEEKVIAGSCGPEDPWKEARSLTGGDPEAAWSFITTVASRATTLRQFEKLGAGPLAYFWSEHEEAYLPRLAAVAADLPALVNLVIAEERRQALAAHVMTLVYAVADHSREIPGDFHFEVPDALARLASPGAHPLTEQLLLPNWQEFSARGMSERPWSESELAQLVEGYIRAPAPPRNDDEDDWWWTLERLVSTAPHAAWRTILAIIAREKDGVDLALLGAGALETLVSDHGERLAPQILTEIQRNPAFVRALSSCYLFSLSERLLLRLADTCRRLLRAT